MKRILMLVALVASLTSVAQTKMSEKGSILVAFAELNLPRDSRIYGLVLHIGGARSASVHDLPNGWLSTISDKGAGTFVVTAISSAEKCHVSDLESFRDRVVIMPMAESVDPVSIKVSVQYVTPTRAKYPRESDHELVLPADRICMRRIE